MPLVGLIDIKILEYSNPLSISSGGINYYYISRNIEGSIPRGLKYNNTIARAIGITSYVKESYR